MTETQLVERKKIVSSSTNGGNLPLEGDALFFQQLESELYKRLDDGLRKWKAERKSSGIDTTVESILIQVQHPALRNGFYISYGIGHADRHSLRYQLGNMYRELDAKAKFYDAILFDNQLYSNEAAQDDKPFLCRLEESKVGIPSLIPFNLLASGSSKWPMLIVHYSKIDLSFWTDIEKLGKEWETAMIQHAVSACGLENQSEEIRADFYRAKASSLTANPVVTLYNVLIDAIQKSDQHAYSGHLPLFLGSLFFKWNIIYYDRIFIAGKSIRGGVTIGTKCELEPHDYRDLAWRIKSIAIDGLWRISERFRVKGALSAAIGSIMSRNGSHNIGSHVLSALSHNVGTMPDDQVLYQYIQHRMDYVATATTDRPTWCQPTMLVSEMLKRFLSQRHLLNYISRSEGLKGWEFQSDKASFETGGRIKFHIRKIENETNGSLRIARDFIDYDHLENAIDLSEDVSLSVPGGIVGQHAFFTILENIVRNAAKHDWTTPPKRTRALKYHEENSDNESDSPIASIVQTSSGVKEPDGDLDVYIDFEDNPADDSIHFRIWTRLSDVFDGKDIQDSLTRKLNSDEIKELLKRDDLSALPLHHHQQVELARPFIRDDGSLRRENWGLAEMKISAGYLQKAKIEDIGGIGDGGGDIILPICIPDAAAKEQFVPKDVKDVFHLGYQFDVPRSKFVLFLVDKVPESMDDKFLQELKRNGIYVELVGDVTEETELNYQYVVMDRFCGEQLKWLLPFRVIVMVEREKQRLEDKVPIFKRILRKNGEYAGLSEGMKSVSDYLSTIVAECSNARDVSNAIKEDVCSCWVRHLIEQRKDLAGPISLVVSVSDSSNDDSSGKSLITEEDVVEFAFNEGILQAFDTYANTGFGLPDVAANKPVIDALRKLDKLIYKRTSQDSGPQSKSRVDLIKRQLALWLEKSPSGADFMETIAYLNKETPDEKTLRAELRVVSDALGKNVRGSDSWRKNRRKRIDIKKKLDSIQSQTNNPINHLVDFLDSYCAQMKGLLSKYAETIATLPKGFSKSIKPKGTNQDESDQKAETTTMLAWEAAGLSAISRKSCLLRYKRHESIREPSDSYLEALSGTQSYLNTLERLVPTDFKMLAQLAENALLRILIIDERTREFLEKHKNMFARFRNMNVSVADDRKVDLELELLEQDENAQLPEGQSDLKSLSSITIYDAKTGYKRRIAQGLSFDDARAAAIQQARKRYHDEFDVVIIHQGIIDKWLPGASHNPTKVERFLKSLKGVFRYVVITTGRGTPANIPHSGRVLPFSTIQTTLFRQYPEKMILTDAIMNILPVKPGETENEKGER